jgi:hypothetical protein
VPLRANDAHIVCQDRGAAAPANLIDRFEHVRDDLTDLLEGDSDRDSASAFTTPEHLPPVAPSSSSWSLRFEFEGLLDVVPERGLRDLVSRTEPDVLGDVTDTLEQSVLVLELGPSRERQSNALLRRTDDRDDAADSETENSVGQYFFGLRRMLPLARRIIATTSRYSGSTLLKSVC